MGHKTEATQRVSFTVVCVDAPQCQVAFEPEGSVHALRQGDAFRIQIDGPASADLEIVYLPDGLIISAWPGADTRVWNRAGDELPT